MTINLQFPPIPTQDKWRGNVVARAEQSDAAIYLAARNFREGHDHQRLLSY
jgi:hypothetical protein